MPCPGKRHRLTQQQCSGTGPGMARPRRQLRTVESAKAARSSRGPNRVRVDRRQRDHTDGRLDHTVRLAGIDGRQDGNGQPVGAGLDLTSADDKVRRIRRAPRMARPAAPLRSG